MQAETRSEQPLYSIGTAARMLGVSVHTLRMYEREGLVLPFKKESHHRLFSNADIDRLRATRHAIREEKISIEGLKHMLSLVPCWSLLGCSEDDRRVCPAYHGSEGPCWLRRSPGTACEELSCRECTVYKDFFTGARIKEKLKELV